MRAGDFGALLLILAVMAAGCGTAATRTEDTATGQYHPAAADAVRGMVESVSSLVKKSPATYTVDFKINGSAGARKYQLLGTAQFNRKDRLMHVTFMDFIFKSTVAMLFQEGDTIRVYYPVEKKMFLDDARTFDLANYGGASLEYGLLHDMATGTFPLVRGYSVKEGLAANDGSGSMLILQNSDYYETISFKNNAPDRVLLINRKTKEKIEVYVKKIMTQGDSVFFSELVVVSARGELRIEISFNRVQLNTPVKVKTIRDMTIPGTVKTFIM
jgi:hypothetical protein